MSLSALTKTGVTLITLVTLCGCSDSSRKETAAQTRKAAQNQRAQMPRPIAVSGTMSSMSLIAPGDVLPLGPGDKAPPLQLAKFVKGDPVTNFQQDQIYIVEFWATWCGPCLQTLPYVAELKKKYPDDVTVIGITAEDEPTVTEFLQEETDGNGTWSDILNFRIALDNERATQKIWRETSEDEGLPFAMIVGRTGLIEWRGHPATMAIPLKGVVEGTWDRKAARKLMEQEVAGQRSIDRSQQAILTAVNAGNYREAVGITDRMLEKMPNNRKILSLQKQLMLDGKLYNRMNKVLAKLVQLSNDDPTELNAIAWNITAELEIPERDLDLALKAARRASELTDHQSATILDTVARVHYERDEIAEAIEWQQKAVDVDPNSDQLANDLKKYLGELASELAED